MQAPAARTSLVCTHMCRVSKRGTEGKPNVQQFVVDKDILARRVGQILKTIPIFKNITIIALSNVGSKVSWGKSFRHDLSILLETEMRILTRRWAVGPASLFCHLFNFAGARCILILLYNDLRTPQHKTIIYIQQHILWGPVFGAFFRSHIR